MYSTETNPASDVIRQSPLYRAAFIKSRLPPYSRDRGPKTAAMVTWLETVRRYSIDCLPDPDCPTEWKGIRPARVVLLTVEGLGTYAETHLPRGLGGHRRCDLVGSDQRVRFSVRLALVGEETGRLVQGMFRKIYRKLGRPRRKCIEAVTMETGDEDGWATVGVPYGLGLGQVPSAVTLALRKSFGFRRTRDRVRDRARLAARYGEVMDACAKTGDYSKAVKEVAGTHQVKVRAVRDWVRRFLRAVEPGEPVDVLLLMDPRFRAKKQLRTRPSPRRGPRVRYLADMDDPATREDRLKSFRAR